MQKQRQVIIKSSKQDLKDEDDDYDYEFEYGDNSNIELTPKIISIVEG